MSILVANRHLYLTMSSAASYAAIPTVPPLPISSLMLLSSTVRFVGLLAAVVASGRGYLVGGGEGVKITGWCSFKLIIKFTYIIGRRRI